MTERREPDADAWIEKVVKVAGLLGFSPMRTRWRLIRWQDGRRKAARRREQQVTHIRYQHKTCSECGAVQDRDEAACTACGAQLASRRFQVLQRLGVMAPEALSMSTLLAVAILAVYARVWLAGGGGLKSPSSTLLIAFGGHWPPFTAAEPWRLVTAVFLHAGILHLVFNLFALASIGPAIEGLYGRLTMLAVFVITGTLANLGSQWMGLAGVGIGASGGIMGLVGVAAGYGQRVGTAGGRALRDGMLKWAGYTIIMGFAVHANNWAHAYGLVLGAAFGYAVRIEVWPRPALWPVRALAKLVGVVGTVGALVLIFTRTPPPPAPTAEDGASGRNGFIVAIESCRALYLGHPDEAITAMEGIAPQFAQKLTAADIEQMCDGVYELRDRCQRGLPLEGGHGAGDPGSRDSEVNERVMCERWQRPLRRLPDRPARPKTDDTTPAGSAASAGNAAPTGSAASAGNAAPATSAGAAGNAAPAGRAASSENAVGSAGSAAPAAH